MDIPNECTVLVIGGGPGGSYAASVLAREGIETVFLEADQFPRYHIGESLLPPARSFLEFIGAYEVFEKHKFNHKDNASLKMNSKPPAFTDFLPYSGHSWNVDRSEWDDLLFKHAGVCGATVIDGVKVRSIEFDPPSNQNNDAPMGTPVSASWSRKDGTSGTIRFKYLVDASGRAGLVSTKYMKNRLFYEGLKNTATWGYYKNADAYGVGTPAEGGPYFTSLPDGSGWAWFIPLKDKVSVGVVMEQTSVTAKKKQMDSPSTEKFFLEQIKQAPAIPDLLTKATLDSKIKSASDWSYSASSYAGPNLRIVGDAGCFVDPLYSSGVHIAMTGALSAAATICASRRGTRSEKDAGDWHSQRIRTTYARYLLVVTCTYGQMIGRESPILTEDVKENFQRVFDLIRPVIQGTMEEIDAEVSPDEISKCLDCCLHALGKMDGLKNYTAGTVREGLLGHDFQSKAFNAAFRDMQSSCSGDMNGWAINAKHGELGLLKV